MLPRRIGWLAAPALLLAALAAMGGGSAHGASTGGTVVSATVASATSINGAGCASGSSNVTDFGTVMPTVSYITSSNCVVTFGSSNDTAQLRVSQTDAFGDALTQPSDGTLDTGFDGDGIATTAVTAGVGDDTLTSVALQSDGKAVAAGACDPGGGFGIDFCVVRYTTTGALDGTFSGDGIATVPFEAGFANDYPAAIIVQPDGAILVAGGCWMAGTGDDFCVARLTSAGVLDATFAGDGTTTTAVAAGGGRDASAHMVLMNDGRIVLVGECDMGATGNDLCAVRYADDGTLDTSLAGDGSVTAAVAAGAADDLGREAVVSADGSITLAGECDMGAPDWDHCLVRWHEDGTLDTTFSGDGKVSVDVSNDWDYLDALAVQADGALVTAGDCYVDGINSNDGCMVRLTSAGALDNTFDVDGKLVVPVGLAANNDEFLSVDVLPDGRILVGGRCAPGGSGLDLCIARFTSTGAFDTTFSGDGKVFTPVAAGAGHDRGHEIAVSAAGRMIIAGRCMMGGATGQDMCIASYGGGGSFSQYQDAVADWNTAATTSMFGACLHGVAAGATEQWTVPGGGCATSDGPEWNDLPTTPEKVAYTTVGGTLAAVANLRFGLRAASSQPPGLYVAPVTFDVLAPDA